MPLYSLAQSNGSALLHWGLPLGILALGLIVATLVVLKMSRVRVPPNQALVVTGAGETQFFTDGVVRVWPVLQQACTLTLRSVERTLDLDDMPIKNNDRLSVTAELTATIGEDRRMLAAAAQRLIDSDAGEIEAMVDELAAGQIRNTAAQHDAAEIEQNTQEFQTQCRAACEADLNQLGLRVVDFELTDVQTKQT